MFGHSYNTSGEPLVLVHNLAAEPQSVTLDLGQDDFSHLDELVGTERHPMDQGRADLELEPYGYGWYRTSSAAQ